ncbi:MAG: hypothetical protein ACFFDI_25560 [Promethearchaeota archaeon]
MIIDLFLGKKTMFESEKLDFLSPTYENSWSPGIHELYCLEKVPIDTGWKWFIIIKHAKNKHNTPNDGFNIFFLFISFH